jgi:hypothetical protein
MALLAEYAKAVISRKRWIVLTLPAWIVGGMKALADAFPQVAFLSAFHRPTWWAWVAAGAIGLILAQAFAWREQQKHIYELSGRPELIVNVIDRGTLGFNVHNVTAHIAVIITASDIVVPIPARVMEKHKELYEGLAITDTEPETEWAIRFETIDSLSEGDYSDIGYRIEGVGQLQRTDLFYMLENLTDDSGRTTVVPFTLAFSNLGDPRRTWHSHYQLRHNILNGRKANLVSTGVAEVNKETKRCRYCNQTKLPYTPISHEPS